MTFKLYGALALILVIIIGIFFFYFKTQNPLSPPQLKFNASRAAVLKEIKQLNRLETASFTIEKIIEAGTDGNAFQEILYGDRILLIAHGQIIAGVDLSKLKESDIQVSGTNITLNLPAPEILITSLDNQKTTVYDRSQGLLSKGDKDLEAQARQRAEESIRQAACDSDILQTASDNARKQLKVLLTALGFTSVTIQIPDTSC